MYHPFLEAVAGELGDRGIATFRYQFPFMENGAKRPDPPRLAHATVQAAVAEAARMLPDVPLIVGGRSFGGRMTSQAQAASPLPGIRGLAFLAFPLHPAGRPSTDRATHLADVHIPTLFLQGTRDALADTPLLDQIAGQLGERATLRTLQDADHAFHVPARLGRSDAEVRREMLDVLTTWIDSVLSSPHYGQPTGSLPSQ